jgi:adenine phosphoribosyltransferase
MMAGLRPVRRLGSEIAEVAALVGLPELGGSALLKTAGLQGSSVCDFEGY